MNGTVPLKISRPTLAPRFPVSFLHNINPHTETQNIAFATTFRSFGSDDEMDVLIDAVYQQSQSSHPPSNTSHRGHPYQSDQTVATLPTPETGPSPSSTSSSQPHYQSHTSHTGPPHRCHLCARTYERADHLNRHLKSHENARPYKCSRCSKSFNRADLLNRHEASHDRHAQGDARPRIERGERVSTACRACVSSKSKCQDQKPCARCVKRGIVCEGGRGSRDAELPITSSPLAKRENLVGDDHRQSQSLAGGSSVSSQRGYDTPASMHNDHFPTNVLGVQPASMLNQPPPSGMGAAGSSYYSGDTTSANSFYVGPFQHPGYMPNQSQFSQGLGFMPRDLPPDSYFGQELDFGTLDIDLETVELAYQFKSTGVKGSSSSSDRGPRNPKKGAAKRFAAFERSPWLFTAAIKGNKWTGQEDLDVNEDKIPSVLKPASPAATMDDYSSCCISSKARDQMIGLLYTAQKSPTQTPAFPSLALLNSMIEIYFVQESFRVDQMIHSATFKPEEALPHLLMAIVAAGSTNISEPVIWKLGLALQEVARRTLGEYWEHDNSTTRNIQSIQAFVMVLEVGLWSGFKRKVELAEALGQTITVMLRRAGAFGGTRYASAVIPERSDSVSELESKWETWIMRESWKRLVLFLFMHDVQCSIGLLKPPLISFNELQFELPGSRYLWLAKSALEWRDRYLSTPPPSDLSGTTLSDAMQNPELLVHLSSHVEMHLSAKVLLHGFWGQIYSLLESKKFYPPSKATHRLCLMSSQTELCRDVCVFQALLPSLTNHSAVEPLFADMFMMVLYVSLDSLQRFAGKYGEEESRLASAHFAEWSKLPDSRNAVWHAGQIFYAAQRLGQAQCRDFAAVSLYYATLTLWVYGLMISSSSRPSSSSNLMSARQMVVLNGCEDPIVRSWRSNNEGIPGINAISPDASSVMYVPVEDTDQVLQFARNLFRNNYPQGDGVVEGGVPPLVQNLEILLKDLGEMTENMLSAGESDASGG